MVVGEDGKRHRQYLPYELAASDAELGDCIARLRRRMCGALSSRRVYLGVTKVK